MLVLHTFEIVVRSQPFPFNDLATLQHETVVGLEPASLPRGVYLDPLDRVRSQFVLCEEPGG